MWTFLLCKMLYINPLCFALFFLVFYAQKDAFFAPKNIFFVIFHLFRHIFRAYNLHCCLIFCHVYSLFIDFFLTLHVVKQLKQLLAERERIMS